MNGLFIDPVRLPIGSFEIDLEKIKENDVPEEGPTRTVLVSKNNDVTNNFLEKLGSKLLNMNLGQLFDFPLEEILSKEVINEFKKNVTQQEIKLLGLYSVSEKEIYYFQPDTYREIVEIHERYHALHHLMKDDDNNIWDDFGDVPSFYKELLAQLFTWNYINDSRRDLVQPFRDLNEHQPLIYKTWKIFEWWSIDKIIELYWAIRERITTKKSLGVLGEVNKIIVTIGKANKTIDSAVFDGIRKTINRFREKPFHYFTEADIHSSLLNDMMSGSSDVLAIRPPNLDKISISLVHQEYPTNFRYKKSEILNAMFDDQTMKDTCLENDNHYGDRGNFDLVVLNPEFILSIIDEANVLDSLQHIINKDIHFAKERKSSNQNDHDNEILYAIEVKFIHIFNARKIHMLYEIIMDNNKLKYAQEHSSKKIRALNLIFCSTNDNKLRGNRDSVINIIKEFFDKGEIEIQENALQMKAEMPEEILSIFIESHIDNIGDKSIKVTSKPIFNKKHPVWAEELIKLLKLDY